MINTPDWTRPTINTVYPYNNFIEFERWCYHWYSEGKWGSINGREYLPIFFCAYQVNNGYGSDRVAMDKLQDFIDTLPNEKRYWTCSQYDDGVGIDWEGKDVIEFNMSKKGEGKYPMPLICQPHPYKFPESVPKKYFASFIGNRTHPLRNDLEKLVGKDERIYVSFENHNIEKYCEILSQSLFSLCPRGYGLSSFRIAESLQYGAIPVYYSDEFIIPHNIPFETYGVKIDAGVDILDYLSKTEPLEIYKKQQNIKEAYEKLYTYEGNFNLIIEHLRNEA